MATWFNDGKFGIFIHWGPYSVPAAFNEWYPRNMYQPHMKEFAYHRKVWGDQKDFGYKDFIPLFTAKRWDPQAWARLFKRSGARYVVPVGEHHDSFAMYRSSHTRWNSVAMGPRRDVLGELGAAVRREGLVLGTSSHLAFNWWYMRKNTHFDTSDPANADLYGGIHDVATSLRKLPKRLWWHLFDGSRPDRHFLDLWWKRTTEIVDRYKPQLLYFDWCWGQPEWDKLRPKFRDFYYARGRKWKKEVVLIYKDETLPYGTATYDVERGGLPDIQPRPWQTCTSISWKSWCHIKGDSLRSAESLVHLLCDIVSKNGNLLLNVGPKSDGTIPAGQASRLEEMGEWLKVNGEAVYGTRPWRRYGEGPTRPAGGGFSEKKEFRYTPQDLRFTRKGNKLYAIALGWPGKELKVASMGREGLLGGKIKALRLLGHAGKPAWSQERHFLKVAMPSKKPCKHAYVVECVVRGGEDF